MNDNKRSEIIRMLAARIMQEVAGGLLFGKTINLNDDNEVLVAAVFWSEHIHDDDKQTDFTPSSSSS